MINAQSLSLVRYQATGVSALHRENAMRELALTYRRARRRTVVLFTACDLHFLRVRTARKLAGKNVHVESENPRALPANIFLYLRYSEPPYNTLALNLPAICYEHLCASYLKD